MKRTTDVEASLKFTPLLQGNRNHENGRVCRGYILWRCQRRPSPIRHVVRRSAESKRTTRRRRQGRSGQGPHRRRAGQEDQRLLRQEPYRQGVGGDGEGDGRLTLCARRAAIPPSLLVRRHATMLALDA